MFQRYKYVMFTDKNGNQFPVIFPDHINHDHMSEAVQSAERYSELDRGLKSWACSKPTSAGFISGLTVAYAGGTSESLSIQSELNDKAIINSKA